MKHYVLGFMFSPDRAQVALIRKRKPAWQAGKLNGIGGKVERTDSSPGAAMVREFEEETGVKTVRADWESFAVIKGKDFCVVCFRAFALSRPRLQALTAEVPHWCSARLIGISAADVIPNLNYLIPAALYTDHRSFITINEE